uniref:Uncharacterized protein n=1 Tax=Ovis aries TaxID=9940 RepID=A0AC11D222_SHEEP
MAKGPLQCDEERRKRDFRHFEEDPGASEYLDEEPISEPYGMLKNSENQGSDQHFEECNGVSRASVFCLCSSCFKILFSEKGKMPEACLILASSYIYSTATCTPMFIAALFIIARTWKQPRCPSADEWIRKLWYIYTMEYYSAVKKNSFESVLMRWMKLEPIIQSEVSQKEKHQYSILTHIYGI